MRINSFIAIAICVMGLWTQQAQSKGFFGRTTATNLPSKKSYEPFDTMAQFLLRFGTNTDLEEYTVEEISRAMRALTKSQNALKTMDGLTHSFRNVIKESSSLQSRFEKFLSTKRKKLKEAAKIVEYTRTVERGLQSAEIIQACGVKEEALRREYLAEAGLQELKRVDICVDKMKLVVSVLVPVEQENDSVNTTATINSTSNTTTNTTNDTTNDTTNTTNTTNATPLPYTTFTNKVQREAERRLHSTPRRYHRNEVILCVSEVVGRESSNIAQMLRLITRSNQHTTLTMHTDSDSMSSGGGSGSDVLTLQSTYLALVHQALDQIGDCLYEPHTTPTNTTTTTTNSINTTTQNNCTTSITTEDTPYRSNPLLQRSGLMDSVFVKRGRMVHNTGVSDGNIDSRSKSISNDSTTDDRRSSNSIQDTPTTPTTTATISTPTTLRPRHNSVRVIGHSAGGSVAALMALVLDGGVYSSGCDSGSNGGGSDVYSADTISTSIDDTTIPNHPLTTTSTTHTATTTVLHPLTGLYAQRVHCTALGPAPCMNRVCVPRYITSVVCGDDAIPRAQAGALRGLRDRVSKALKAGAGRSHLGYMLSAGVLSDLTKLAGKSIGHYKGKKSAVKDSAELSVPGRVFYIKPRQLKEGATIQRVMRGNWQEDMLWQLREIVVSKRMLEHHTLDCYIRTLNRC